MQNLSENDKLECYAEVERAYGALIKEPLPKEIHMLHLCAILQHHLGFFWVGFYMRKSAQMLEIGPYQGQVPCFTIKLGNGACGTAAASGEVVNLPDVNAFPGYIACHAEPQSEMVVPGMVEGECVFVLDVDHQEREAFTNVDATALKRLVQLTIETFFTP